MVTSANYSLTLEQDACLNFKLDSELKIVAAQEQGGMKFLYPESTFMGMVITQAVPLSEEDQLALDAAFGQAYETGDLVHAEYALEGIKFLAAVQYEEGYFFVKVTEIDVQ